MSAVENEYPLSFGKKLVGITFNPSGDPKIQRVKEICAELADIVHDHHNRDLYADKGKFDDLLYEHAIGEILNAQMNAVKYLVQK